MTIVQHVLVAAVFAASTFIAPLAAGAVGQSGPPAAGQPQLPRGQMPDLGRTTKGDDEVPLFDFDAYFPGRWTFQWDVPDSPLGPAGRIEGATVYTKIGDGIYEAVTTAKGPAGAFTINERITYQREQKKLTRDVTDSRGFKYSQSATIGGDLGGFYNIFFDSPPFAAGGKSVRVKHNIRTGSPLAYRVAALISVDGGPYTNYGNPWWRKDQ
jgi:hypothetical protein